MAEAPIVGVRDYSNPDHRNDEPAKVEAWRLQELLHAGYTLNHAETLAADTDVDLHHAVQLVTDGCPPVTAFEILR